MGRILGVDSGDRRIGLAVSDETGVVACGLGTAVVSGRSGAIEEITNAARRAGADTIVVGLPLNMDGTSGPRAEAARALAGELRLASGCRVELWDERMSTMQAERALLEGGMSRAKRRKARDRMAAQLILQSYMDAHADAQGDSGQ